MPRPPSTYRLQLVREDTNAAVYQWGNIPEDKLLPVLQALQKYLPMIIHAGQAKAAVNDLVDAASRLMGRR